MANDTKHQCAGTTRFGRPCKNLVPSSAIFCTTHKPLLRYADAWATLDALRDLGMLKEGELPIIDHDPWCPFVRDHSQPCTCAQVEITWAEFDQRFAKAAR